MPVRLTPAQREILLQCQEDTITVSGDNQMRVAEQLTFRKWTTMVGPLRGPWNVTITEAGKKALLEDTGKPRPPKKFSQL